MQTHNLGWLTPKRMRALTIGAMCTAGLVATVGVSGATPPASHGTPTAKLAAASRPITP